MLMVIAIITVVSLGLRGNVIAVTAVTTPLPLLPTTTTITLTTSDTGMMYCIKCNMKYYNLLFLFFL